MKTATEKQTNKYRKLIDLDEDKLFSQIMIDDMNHADVNNYLIGPELKFFEKELDKYRQ
jgi:cellobiose-specific phosphotransferase system component IIB